MTKKSITIQGLDFEVSTPYAEGHVITEAEAKALNQTRLENIRNNMARVIKTEQGDAETLPDGAYETLKTKLAEYDAAYVFTLASVGGGRKATDPVDVEALRIARSEISRQLHAAGRKVKEIDPEAYANALATMADKPAVRKLAEKNVKERANSAAMDLAELGLA
jgi:hypothetical protein